VHENGKLIFQKLCVDKLMKNELDLDLDDEVTTKIREARLNELMMKAREQEQLASINRNLSIYRYDEILFKHLY
jgi:hypothetical protein